MDTQAYERTHNKEKKSMHKLEGIKNNTTTVAVFF